MYDNIFLRGHVSGEGKHLTRQNQRFVPGYLAIFLWEFLWHKRASFQVAHVEYLKTYISPSDRFIDMRWLLYYLFFSLATSFPPAQWSVLSALLTDATLVNSKVQSLILCHPSFKSLLLHFFRWQYRLFLKSLIFDFGMLYQDAMKYTTNQLRIFFWSMMGEKLSLIDLTFFILYLDQLWATLEYVEGQFRW